MGKEKRLWTAIAAGCLAMGALCGCTQAAQEGAEEGGAKAPKEAAVLELEVGYTGDTLEQFRTVVDGFSKETGIQIELVTPGADYETVMKTRMASGDMPDIFLTHGWSIARYKEYLEELGDEPWTEYLSDSVREVITDEEGKLYVLCVTQGINGIEYNREVLEQAGVEAADIRTMDDFMEACGKIKAAGITPVFMGGKDDWMSANLMGNFAPAYFTAEGCAYPGKEAMKDGSFQWETDGKAFFNQIRDMVNNGYFNEDFVTADEVQGFEALANGKCAFLVGGIAVDKITAYNGDAQIGTMPVPSTSESGKSQYMVGEGSAFGIWKDSEYMDEAKQFLEYLARPEIAEKIVAADGQIPALTNIDTAGSLTYQIFTESESEFDGDICYDNIFDREYLPNGMWSVMTDSVMEVLMDPTDEGVANAAENMQENYVEKLEAEQ